MNHSHPFTDDELIQLWNTATRTEFNGEYPSAQMQYWVTFRPPTVKALIAALRTERATTERLQDELAATWTILDVDDLDEIEDE